MPKFFNYALLFQTILRTHFFCLNLVGYNLMKKPIAILLVTLIVLNTMGYYGVFMGLKYHNTLSINERLDDERYLESQTEKFRIPLSIPYAANTDWQRVSGELEARGEIYHLVKQKYENDTLYFVCYKDVKSKRLQQALVDYVMGFTDQTTDSGSAKSLPSFLKDYIATDLKIISSSSGWGYAIQFTESESPLTTVAHTILSPPPEA